METRPASGLFQCAKCHEMIRPPEPIARDETSQFGYYVHAACAALTPAPKSTYNPDAISDAHRRILDANATSPWLIRRGQWVRR